jgi:hypothetical protein
VTGFSGFWLHRYGKKIFFCVSEDFNFGRNFRLTVAILLAIDRGNVAL